MPYIDDKAKKNVKEFGPTTPGELNYFITTTVLSYLNRVSSGKVKYAHVNDVIGALEACKLEFYRRYAAPYEDTKILENGDVY